MTTKIGGLFIKKGIKNILLTVVLIALAVLAVAFGLLPYVIVIEAQGTVSIAVQRNIPQQEAPWLEAQTRDKTPWGYEYTTHSGDKVEVGDSTTLDFKPVAKLFRFGDRAWLELGYSTALKTDPVEIDTNKLVWSSTETDIEFYTVEPEGNRNQLGGLEYAITLKEKPPANVIALVMQSEGLKFYYQPPLTSLFTAGWDDEYQTYVSVNETDVWDTATTENLVHRPDRIAGGYAVYYTDASIDTSTIVKTGKAFTIERPLINDSVWGEIGIDSNEGLVYITIPEKYYEDLENYPMRIDPTIGFTEIGDTNGNFINYLGAGGKWDSDGWSANATGTADYMKIYAYVTSGTTVVYQGYYEDNGSQYPGSYVTSDNTGVVINSTPGWWQSNTISGEITNGTKYWPVWCADDTIKLYYDNGVGIIYYYNSGDVFDDPYGAGASSVSRLASCYINYAEEGGCSPDISNTPDSYDFGILAEGASANTGLDYFNVTNSSGGAVDITITGTNMTGGTQWTLANDGNPGSDIVALIAGIYGGSFNTTINGSTNPFIYGLADSANQTWGVLIKAPTSFSDGVAKSGNVTIEATCQ